MAQAPTIDVLLRLLPERPQLVHDKLTSHPELAHKHDQHGYSLVHAAASYGHVELLKALINEFSVDPNVKDEDGETALFSVEEVSLAKELLALGVDVNARNDEGQTAAEKLADEDEQPAIAAYLREIPGISPPGRDSEPMANGGETQSHFPPPPPLPEGLQLNIGTMVPEEGDLNPEMRRRIEELAARSDFETEECQRELRKIIADALSDTTGDHQSPPASRRRLD